MLPAAAVAVRTTAVAVAVAAAVVSVVALLLQLLLRLLLLRVSSGINYEATLYAVYNLLFSQYNYVSLCIQR